MAAYLHQSLGVCTDASSRVYCGYIEIYDSLACSSGVAKGRVSGVKPPSPIGQEKSFFKGYLST
jgi:hypothetical protein